MDTQDLLDETDTQDLLDEISYLEKISSKYFEDRQRSQRNEYLIAGLEMRGTENANNLIKTMRSENDERNQT